MSVARVWVELWLAENVIQWKPSLVWDTHQFSYHLFASLMNMTISLVHAISSLFVTFSQGIEFSIYHKVALAPIRSPSWSLFSLDTNLLMGLLDNSRLLQPEPVLWSGLVRQALFESWSSKKIFRGNPTLVIPYSSSYSVGDLESSRWTDYWIVDILVTHMG